MADVVLVHGLWNRGWMMASMARRLRKSGHRVSVFSYPTRAADLDGHADALHDFLHDKRAQELHLVGHSMGGLVILDMLSRYDDLPPGRVVLMGTPVKGSAVVRRMAKLPGQDFIFGKSREDLLKGCRYSPEGRETGMIRGTRPFGFGQITGKHDEPNDGSIRVSETELEGLKDTVELDVAHSEMLVSKKVVEQVECFLLTGRFEKDT
ncbi:MAG: alpha/beta hydrolase [Lysobacterales bacterium]